MRKKGLVSLQFGGLKPKIWGRICCACQEGLMVYDITVMGGHAEEITAETRGKRDSGLWFALFITACSCKNQPGSYENYSNVF